MASSTPTACALCNNAPTMPCPGCSATLYCSPSCLADDTAVHSLVCAAFASPPAKPTEGKHVLGLLFPATGTTPQPVWVRLDGFADEDTGISFQEAEVAPFFDLPAGSNATVSTPPSELHSERNRVRNRDTRSMLEVWHVPAAASGDGSSLPENECIKALAGLTASQEGPFYAWHGAVLVLAMTRSTGFMVDPGQYRDVNVVDFGDAVDVVLDYGNEAHGRKIREALESLGAKAAVEEMSDGEDVDADGTDKAKGDAKDEKVNASVVEMAG